MVGVNYVYTFLFGGALGYIYDYGLQVIHKALKLQISEISGERQLEEIRVIRKGVCVLSPALQISNESQIQASSRIQQYKKRVLFMQLRTSTIVVLQEIN